MILAIIINNAHVTGPLDHGISSQRGSCIGTSLSLLFSLLLASNIGLNAGYVRQLNSPSPLLNIRPAICIHETKKRIPCAALREKKR